MPIVRYMACNTWLVDNKIVNVWRVFRTREDQTSGHTWRVGDCNGSCHSWHTHAQLVYLYTNTCSGHNNLARLHQYFIVYKLLFQTVWLPLLTMLFQNFGITCVTAMNISIKIIILVSNAKFFLVWWVKDGNAVCRLIVECNKNGC